MPLGYSGLLPCLSLVAGGMLPKTFSLRYGRNRMVSPSLFSSQDGLYFGPFKCNDEYLGKSRPALFTNLKEDHPEIRDFSIAAIRERLSSTQPCLAHASDNFYKNLWVNGEKPYLWAWMRNCVFWLVALFLHILVCRMVGEEVVRLSFLYACLSNKWGEAFVSRSFPVCFCGDA